MSTDFIPVRDSNFNTWANDFVSAVKTAGAAYGLTAAQLAELQTAADAWDDKYTELSRQRDAAKAATQGKDETRAAFEGLLRSLSRKIQGDPAITNERRVEAGLPVHSGSRTPVPVPNNAPVANIDACNIQEHRIRFSESLSPNALVRPRGIYGIQIYMSIGNTPPVDENAFHQHSVATRMNTSIAFSGTDAGKTAYYRFRYINTKGDLGPLSMVYNATIMK